MSLTVLSGGKFSIHFHNCSKCTSKLQYYYYSTSFFLSYLYLLVLFLLPLSISLSGICVLHLNLLKTVALELYQKRWNTMRTQCEPVSSELLGSASTTQVHTSLCLSVYVCVCGATETEPQIILICVK